MDIPSEDIDDEEIVARYVLYERRKKPCRPDGTVKRYVFTPPKNGRCSVTRHIGYSTQDIWRVGNIVAAKRSKSLIGRADVSVEKIRAIGLDISPERLEDDKNHANIIGWSNLDSFHDGFKMDQELADASMYVELES
ncbi:MAG: hypothetical protein COA73_18635 [Candidatus Hydrogenedentota bacterium]|nr:MAG: hypothetical protein COA73_18635 [Candidatus Hydrogenedentota bacterium]